MGDIAFWQTAFMEHGSDVLAFLVARLRRRADAEDLLQETFVRAIRAPHPLRCRDRVRSYLFTIAHHLSLDHLQRRREVLFSEGDDRLRSVLDAAASGAAGPEAEAELVELRQALLAARQRLGPSLAPAFDLGIVARRPYAEIAAATGWSLAQVRVNVHRVRRRLLRELGLSLEVHR